ncbi:alpha/beta hydrolase [Gordonia sp. DT219]|uniref:alpha/beta hydrolase n=1 Tax=Gordonia sp. DT219 TaxID=3416658 RepID=UPI003CE8FD8D
MPIVAHRTPSRLSYPIWIGSRLFLKPLLTLWPLNRPGMAGLFLIDRMFAVGKKPHGVVREQAELGDRPAEVVVPTGPSRRDADTAILYLHGGAFVVGGLGTHRSIAARLSRACELPVFSLVYRQLPAAGVGASVADAMAAYRELLTERGYRRVIVAGDSAGGFLAAKVVEGAAAQSLPAPAAVIGFSPLLDLELGDNPDRSSRCDAYIPRSAMIRLAPHFFGGPVAFTGVRRIGDLDLHDFPPTLLFTAENELLEPDAVALVEGLDEVGVTAQVHSYSWQIHAFPVFDFRHRETLEAIEASAEFTGRVIREAKNADDRENKRAG